MIGSLRDPAWSAGVLALVGYAGLRWFRGLRKETADGIAAVMGTGADGGPVLHPPVEALVTLAFIGAWIVLTTGRPSDPGGAPSLPIPFSSGVLAWVGTASLVALLIILVVPVRVPGLLLVAGGAVCALAVVIHRRAGPRTGTGGAVPPDMPTDKPSGIDRIVWVATSVALALLAWNLGRDAAYLAFFRPEAAGDEAYFWWRATSELHQLGLYGYLAGFAVAGYPPGYPLVGNFLIGWLPGGLFEAAGRALPFLFGFSVVWTLLGDLVRRRGLLGPTAGVYYVLAYVLFFHTGWIHTLYFQLWYGEAFATLLFGTLLVLLDYGRRHKPHGRALRLAALAAFGLGALAVLSKPPLSLLVVPAILPAIGLVVFALSPGRCPGRSFVTIISGAALGALVTQLTWGIVLSTTPTGAFYSVDLGALFAFRPEGAIARLIPYFFEGYQTVWVVFILTSVLAGLHDWRRFLPFWLVSAGMVASVFLLYLGAWSNVEHESGVRYILHGAYGWIIFSLGALAMPISETVRHWLSRLAQAPRWRQRTVAPSPDPTD